MKASQWVVQSAARSKSLWNSDWEHRTTPPHTTLPTLPKTHTACTVVLCNEALHLRVMDGELRRAAAAAAAVAMLRRLQCCRPVGTPVMETIGCGHTWAAEQLCCKDRTDFLMYFMFSLKLSWKQREKPLDTHPTCSLWGTVSMFSEAGAQTVSWLISWLMGGKWNCNCLGKGNRTSFSEETI